MKQKLLILDVVLLGVVAYAGFQFRHQWRAAKAREAAALHRQVRPAPPPRLTPLPSAPPVLSAGYAEIAQKMLFDKSRNPTVVIELPPPPPPKPMPPLPAYHGMMNIGEGPTAILSVNNTAVHEAIHPGERIGQFKLVDVNTDEITLEWDGKLIHKSRAEPTEEAPSAAASPPVSAAARTQAQAPAPEQSAAKTPTGPGEITGFGFKLCNPSDSTPVGTVVDGFRKVSLPTPFGVACRWDPVAR